MKYMFTICLLVALFQCSMQTRMVPNYIRGPEGPVGPKGDTGEKGKPGNCYCDAYTSTSTALVLEEKLKLLQSETNQIGQFFERLAIADKVRLCEVGIKSGLVPDSAITASSYWRNHTRHEPRDGRLDGTTSPHSAACWGGNTSNAWIQVRLDKPIWLTGVVTQGRPTEYVQWMKKYRVQYGMTEEDLQFFKEDEHVMVFEGNVDRTSYALGSFPQSVFARIIRIHQGDGESGEGCMRFGVITC